MVREGGREAIVYISANIRLQIHQADYWPVRASHRKSSTGTTSMLSDLLIHATLERI